MQFINRFVMHCKVAHKVNAVYLSVCVECLLMIKAPGVSPYGISQRAPNVAAVEGRLTGISLACDLLFLVSLSLSLSLSIYI